MQIWRLAAYFGLTIPWLAISAPRNFVLTPTSLGQVRLGMYLNAVADAHGNSELFEILRRLNGNHCYTIQSKVVDQSEGVAFIGLRTPDIQRIDIQRTAADDRRSPKTYYMADTVITKEGVKLGDQFSKVQRLYEKSSIYEPPRRVTPEYYIVAMRGSNTGYAFVLDGTTVIELRAGRIEVLDMTGTCR